MHTPREWRRLTDSLSAHADTAQHPIDISRYREAAEQALDLSTYIDTAPEEPLDEAYRLLNAAGLIPTRDDLEVVAVIAARIREEREEQEIAA
ncbi:hypothetical protein [Saccharopolyspora sp. NPDC002376]